MDEKKSLSIQAWTIIFFVIFIIIMSVLVVIFLPRDESDLWGTLLLATSIIILIGVIISIPISLLKFIFPKSRIAKRILKVLEKIYDLLREIRLS